MGQGFSRAVHGRGRLQLAMLNSTIASAGVEGQPHGRIEHDVSVRETSRTRQKPKDPFLPTQREDGTKKLGHPQPGGAVRLSEFQQLSRTFKSYQQAYTRTPALYQCLPEVSDVSVSPSETWLP